MTFTALVSGVSCTCLLDTGSNISIINQSVFDALPGRPPLRKTTVRAKTATHDDLPLLGRTSLRFDFGGTFVAVPVFVSESIDVPCLLGLDFLQVCPCVIDVRRSRLVLTPSAAVHSVSAEAVSVGNVVLGRHTVVPAGEEVVMGAFVPNCEYRGPAVLRATITSLFGGVGSNPTAASGSSGHNHQSLRRRGFESHRCHQIVDRLQS